MLHLLQTPSPRSQHSLSWDMPIPSLEPPLGLNTGDLLDPQCLELALTSPDSSSQDLGYETLAELEAHISHTTSDGFDNPIPHPDPQGFAIQTIWDFPEAYSLSQDSNFATGSESFGDDDGQRKRRARPQSGNWSGYSSVSHSPFSTDSMIMQSSNRSLITENLLRIYHDVLENNLACWLAENTCPYKMQGKGRDPRTMNALTVGGAVPSSIPSEWGAVWSNRMYRRVVQLDRAAQSAKLVQLTRTESQAVSKVLDLAIMAFTTQWAQGSRRQERFPTSMSTPGADDPADLADALNDEFEESFQQSIWEQARRALRDVADVESYRVVYAELIFGLTQKPWSANDHNPLDTRPSSTGRRSGSIKDTTMPLILDIMSQEGPHVYLERATRKIHALKFRFEAKETGFLASNGGRPADKMSGEDMRTIGLLYWLAVMFDTVSSSMNERPVALSDEDCHHDNTQEVLTDPATSAVRAGRWWEVGGKWAVQLFIQDDPEKPSALTRWPCQYDEAMQAIARSAPVKILIYRHVSYLQDALRKRQRGEALENLIQKTTLVYRYWNLTHGSFFRDLVKSYDTIPQRIKSSFFCIAVPWHLGSLMLADLLEFIDANNLGLEGPSKARMSANVASRIRKASAVELSDLARVTTPRDIQQAGVAATQMPDYHFAINDSPLLTEPWTVILVQAFTKACVFHLDVADDFQQHAKAFLGEDSDDFQDSLTRAENCIRALWCLGRKSEMSRNLTKVLAEALQELRL